MSTRGNGTRASAQTALVIGGAGFIGANVAERLIRTEGAVSIFDNLSRPGVQRNLDWLQRTYPRRVRFIRGDVRDASAVALAVSTASKVFHFAAQVAVTTSLTDPRGDFMVNAAGALNVLEAVRARREPPPVVFTSTNKVYGALGDVTLERRAERYMPTDRDIRQHGISEARPLSFHSPYGCSKGAADQYVCDYARTFGIPAVVFRMSCIYGPHQFGTEDQGWVAHFLLRALRGAPLSIYGDGAQVRDVLYVDDLVDALMLAQKHSGELRGRAFNIGGGPARTVSLLELVSIIGALTGRAPAVSFAPWRTADQKYYVSDIRAFMAATGWAPRISVLDGVARLHEWVQRAGLVESATLDAAELQPAG